MADPHDNLLTPTAADALHCPACGYNLHGVCTRERREGNCPECGLAFVRDRLYERQRERAAFPTSLMVMQLLLFPVVIVVGGLFCIAGVVPGVQSTTVVVVVTVGIPLLCALLAGGLIASQYHPRCIAGVLPKDRRGMQRHILYPWLLFFVIEAVLTVVYFVGGCAAILAAFGFL